MSDDRRFINQIKLENFLSYKKSTIELSALNILIGPNTSGKSNLLEAFRLLQATSSDFTVPLRQGGGVREWLWKGNGTGTSAKIDTIVNYPEGIMPIRYGIEFAEENQRVKIINEYIENASPLDGSDDVYFFYRYQYGNPVLNLKPTILNGSLPFDEDDVYGDRAERYLRREDVSPEKSVLSQRTDQDIYPELTYLGNQFANLTLYTDWDLSRSASLRKPQNADERNDFLLESATNLALVLNNLQFHENYPNLLNSLRQFYDESDGLLTKTQGNTVQLYVKEKGMSTPVPATRLSDGTLRYLCLLAILHHPTPPPLICIEEPEMGLHPDILPELAKLFVDASQRTQLVITTHSDALVSALETESILVCERDEDGTFVNRLDPDQLTEWLDEYTLGDLWKMGQIGGNRW